MTTVRLDDVAIAQLGRMLWTPDIAYWSSVAMPVGFQSQTTVWCFGGRGVAWDGFGRGTLDGNGQVWYDRAAGRGNLARRPMNINFRGLREAPFFAWQCEHYEGHMGEDCNSSRFKLQHLAWRRVSGTVNDNVKDTGLFRCSAAAADCDDVQVADIDIRKVGGGRLDSWHCENVHGSKGFRCN